MTVFSRPKFGMVPLGLDDPPSLCFQFVQLRNVTGMISRDRLTVERCLAYPGHAQVQGFPLRGHWELQPDEGKLAKHLERLG